MMHETHTASTISIIIMGRIYIITFLHTMLENSKTKTQTDIRCSAGWICSWSANRWNLENTLSLSRASL